MRQRVDLPYLDGIRGLAALSVVVYHAFLYTGRTGDAFEAMPAWGFLIGFGYLGVPVFIVLSGYVLMIPALSTERLAFPGGLRGFFYRRSRRILPPYFAALIFALLLIAFVPMMQQPSGTQWDTKIPVTPWGVISHALLIHDFSPTEYGTINGPLWSVALEFQIYFLMALVLIPLARKIGTAWTFAAAAIVGIGLAAGDLLAWMHPWLITLFAAGMWAAELTLVPRHTPRWFGPLTVVSLVALGAVAVASTKMSFDKVPWTELTAGFFVAGALVILGRREVDGRSSWVSRVLRHRIMLRIGLVSYSIYLFHSPILGLGNLLLLPLGLPTVAQYAVMMVVVVPVALLVSWGMFQLVERRFLNTRQRRAAEEIDSAAPVPSMEEDSVADASENEPRRS